MLGHVLGHFKKIEKISIGKIEEGNSMNTWINVKTFCCTAVLLSISAVSYADNCDRTNNTYDSVYCTNKIFASADADLNKNYQLLRSKLNASQKKTLKSAQLAWIRERDQQCVDAGIIDVDCRLEQTQQRNQWLVERLRECKTVGCKASRLSE